MLDTIKNLAVPMSDYAIIINPNDNCAIVKKETHNGLQVTLSSGEILTIISNVPPGHRFATVSIPAGKYVTQYGQPIGTSLGIKQGEWITHDNMSDEVPVVRDLPADLQTPEPDYIELDQRGTFMGFRRADGRVGTRNFVLIVPTSMCASHEATQISMMAEFLHYKREKFPNVDGVVAIPHNKGCGCQDGSNLDLMLRTLANYADHPNVGGVILIDLGCEKTNMSKVEKYLLKRELEFDKPFVKIGIQDLGGTQNAIETGLRIVQEMLPVVNESKREKISASELILGVKCGSSDGFSGISANPALGYTSDLVIRNGGSVILTEVPEFCGAEHILANRAKDAETGRAVYGLVDWFKDYAAKFGGVLNNNPSPGNISSGLLNITIKSLGAIAKAGTTRIEGVVDYAEIPKNKGLTLMQGPGYDQESTPGIVASGANVVVFTTGNGSTIGNAIVPVIKLTSNNRVFEKMSGDMDLSAGGVLEGTETIEEVGARLFEYIKKIASGEVLAKAEVQKHREFQFWAEQTVSL